MTKGVRRLSRKNARNNPERTDLELEGIKVNLEIVNYQRGKETEIEEVAHKLEEKMKDLRMSTGKGIAFEVKVKSESERGWMMMTDKEWEEQMKKDAKDASLIDELIQKEEMEQREAWEEVMRDEQHSEHDCDLLLEEGRDDETETTVRRLEEEIEDMEEIERMLHEEKKDLLRAQEEMRRDEQEDLDRLEEAEEARLDALIAEQQEEEEREMRRRPSSQSSSGYDSDGHYVPGGYMDTRAR